MYILGMVSKKSKNMFKKCLISKLTSYTVRKLTCHSRTTILGIETSCDDTACAVVNDKGDVLGETINSQSFVHLRYGGVNPLVARDLHRENIEQVVNETLQKASISMTNIDAIAVTVKPGLLVSLQIGVKYAMFLSKTYNKPIIPIHHMESHALAARMFHDIKFPFLALLISGGHCLLTVVKDVDNFLLLGNTLDNSPGEVLDKAARRMKLRNIPDFSKMIGGKAIEVAATKSNNHNLFDFALPLLKYRDCNFTFSGIQDTFHRHLRKKEKEHHILGDELIPEVYELCAALQTVIAEHIMHRTKRAILFCLKNNLLNENNKDIVVSGGVACNNFIYKTVEGCCHNLGCNVYRPPHKVCTDNGIMIAWNGIEKLKEHKQFPTVSLDCVDPKASLGKDITDMVKDQNIYVRATRLKRMKN